MRLLILLACAIPLSVNAATTLKISTLYPDGTAAVKRIKEAGETIKDQTDGRVELKLYAGGVMGSDQAVKRKIRVGQLDGAFAQASSFSQYYQGSQVYNMPLVFNNYDEVDYVREHLDSAIRQGFENNGWATYGLVDGGFAYLMSSEPVRTVKQARKQKIWLPANDPLSATLADVTDISPIMLDIGNVLTSLQTGAINAFVAPPVAALTLQWHSRVQYLTDMPLIYTYGMLAINKKHLQGIKEADRKVLRNVLEEAVGHMDASRRADNKEAFKAVLNQNVETVSPRASNKQVWQDYAEKANQKLIDDGQVPASMYQRLQQLLADYRQKKAE